MTVFITANPGQNVSITVQVRNQFGERQNSASPPSIDFVYSPSLQALSGYPANMTNINTGLYTIVFDVPNGTSNLGTYIASVSWIHPGNGFTQYELFCINVIYPFSAYSVRA